MPSQMGAAFPSRAWRFTLNLNALLPLFEEFPDGPNDEVPEGAQEKVVDIITAAFAKANQPISPDVADLLDLIRNSDEMWELRQEWESFYDYCDNERIWVDTHGITEGE